jgi:hypothetical protein
MEIKGRTILIPPLESKIKELRQVVGRIKLLKVGGSFRREVFIITSRLPYVTRQIFHIK